MFTQKSALTAFGATLGLVVAATAFTVVSAASSQTLPNRRHTLTFSGPVGLPGVTLAAGTYEFELPSPELSPDLVRVWSKGLKDVYFTGFTEQFERPAGWPENQVVSLGEAGDGMAPPIIAWYPLGDSTAYRFIYRNRRR